VKRSKPVENRVVTADIEMPKNSDVSKRLEKLIENAFTQGVSQARAQVPKNASYAMSQKGKKALQGMTTVRNAPAAKSERVKTTNRPRINTSKRGIIVSHKEMVGTLVSSPTTLTFQANSFTINPGKTIGFPWLSTLACNFDKYKMHSLTVHLVSSQPTSTAGRIGVGVDYDSTDPLPGDRVDFFNLTHHTECAAWDSVSLNIPLRPEEKFVNSHTTTDSKLIDMGMIVVMSDQIVATSSVLADVIFEYQVELLEPQQAPLFTQTFTGPNIGTFSSLVSNGPAIVQMIPTISTTVLEFSIPPGTYLFNFILNDAAAGSPGLAVAIHNGSGRYVNTSNTFDRNQSGAIRSNASDCTIRLTYSSVGIASLETNTLMFTRISPVVFNNLAVTSTVNLNTAVPTY